MLLACRDSVITSELWANQIKVLHIKWGNIWLCPTAPKPTFKACVTAVAVFLFFLVVSFPACMCVYVWKSYPCAHTCALDVVFLLTNLLEKNTFLNHVTPGFILLPYELVVTAWFMLLCCGDSMPQPDIHLQTPRCGVTWTSRTVVWVQSLFQEKAKIKSVCRHSKIAKVHYPSRLLGGQNQSSKWTLFNFQ